MRFDRRPEAVFNAALSLVESRQWEIAEADLNEGRIEATEKLPWFGFRDDVVIRIEPDNGFTRFDMRSKSRIGRGDLGVNAKRILQFTGDLKTALNTY